MSKHKLYSHDGICSDCTNDQINPELSEPGCYYDGPAKGKMIEDIDRPVPVPIPEPATFSMWSSGIKHEYVRKEDYERLAKAYIGRDVMCTIYQKQIKRMKDHEQYLLSKINESNDGWCSNCCQYNDNH